METGACTLGAIDVDTIQEQHVRRNVEIQRTAEALDQRDRAGVCALLGVTGFVDQVCCNGAVDNAQHPAHDRRPAGEQKAQWIRQTHCRGLYQLPTAA